MVQVAAAQLRKSHDHWGTSLARVVAYVSRWYCLSVVLPFPLIRSRVNKPLCFKIKPMRSIFSLVNKHELCLALHCLASLGHLS